MDRGIKKRGKQEEETMRGTLKMRDIHFSTSEQT